MGLNEFAGYVAVAAVAFGTAWIASQYGLRPYPFYIGIALTVLGLLFSIVFIKDTAQHIAHETITSELPRLKKVFSETSWINKNLGSVTQAGLVNNLNDALTWGLLPILLVAKGFSIRDVGIVTAIYPAVWGVGQLFTGRMADNFCKKDLLFWGMLLQGIALVALLFASTITHFIVLSVVLGWGTAMVYPTFLATVAENTHPADRAKSIGVFRFGRDMGYALGAIFTGIIADMLNINAAIFFVGALTVVSSGIILFRMRCKDTPPGGLDMAWNGVS
jgi:MFS family permease